MEIYQLEDLIAVTEEHSFTRASDRVGRSQAAVSVAIRKLEQEVGLPLVAREYHDCALTEVGQVVLAFARRMIELRDEMQRAFAEVTSVGAGRLSIAANESAAHYLLPAPLSAFHKKCRAIKIESRLCEVDEIADLVAHREVDLGFGIRQVNLRGLSSEVILADPQILIVAPTHRLARQRSVRIADLGDEGFFIHTLGTWTVDAIQRLFEKHHAAFTVVAELGNFEAVKHFVKTGLGIAITAQCAARADIEKGELVCVEVTDLKICRTIEAIYRERSTLLPAPAAFLRILRNWRWDGGRDELPTAPAVGSEGVLMPIMDREAKNLRGEKRRGRVVASASRIKGLPQASRRK